MIQTHQCPSHSGHETDIVNLKRELTEIKADFKEHKLLNTNTHNDIYGQIRVAKEEQGTFKTKILSRVGKLDRKTAGLYAAISVASYFIFELLKFLGMMLIKGMK